MPEMTHFAIPGLIDQLILTTQVKKAVFNKYFSQEDLSLNLEDT